MGFGGRAPRLGVWGGSLSRKRERIQVDGFLGGNSVPQAASGLTISGASGWDLLRVRESGFFFLVPSGALRGEKP